MEVLCPTRGKRNETDYYGWFFIWRTDHQTESNFVSILSSHLCDIIPVYLLCTDLKWMWKSSVCWVQYVRSRIEFSTVQCGVVICVYAFWYIYRRNSFAFLVLQSMQWVNDLSVCLNAERNTELFTRMHVLCEHQNRE